MLSVITLPASASPPRKSYLGRWLSVLPDATRSGVAVTSAGDVTSTAFVWGYALRREWPDGRHDLFGFTANQAVAKRRLSRDEGYWRDGPVRPVAVYVVPANAADVYRHPVEGCHSPSCPNLPERGQGR